MKIAVIGSKDLSSYTILTGYLNSFVKPDDIIVTGFNEGTESLAVQYAIDHNIQFERCDSESYKVIEYFKDNPSYVEFERDESIIQKSEFCIIFWDDSHAVDRHVRIARIRKIPTLIVYF